MPLNHNQQGRQPNSPLITESRDCSGNLGCNHILPSPFLSNHHQHHHGLQLTLSVTALRYLSLGQDSSREEVRTTSATSVYEVARPILQGCHAIPTKLKILLDRALSALAQEEVLMIVSGCGWQLDDYQRGYKLKVTYPLFTSACLVLQSPHARYDPQWALGRAYTLKWIQMTSRRNFHISLHTHTHTQTTFSPRASWAIFMYSYFPSFCAN